MIINCPKCGQFGFEIKTTPGCREFGDMPHKILIQVEDAICPSCGYIGDFGAVQVRALASGAFWMSTFEFRDMKWYWRAYRFELWLKRYWPGCNRLLMSLPFFRSHLGRDV